jgi:sulfite reductase (NADPH) hemoprotein beta-component
VSVNTSNLSDLEELDRFEKALQAFFSGHIDTDRFTAIRLQLGVYGQRQEGVNMVRIKLPGGRLTPLQLDTLADVTDTYSQRGIGHITTRQTMQIHYVPLAKAPDALRRLAKAGLTTREACGNTVRNMTTCVLSGVCPREHVDVGMHVDGAVRHFLRNPLNQLLPRKFKISFSACEADCAQSLLHDAGVVAVKKDGKHGFMVKACGGLGHKPHEAIVVEEFIPESELLFSLEAVVTLHNKYSDRSKRAKSRIKFLVDRFGVQGFLEKYREEFIRTKEALSNQPYPQGAWREQSGSEIPGPGAPRKLFAQHQPGLFVLPVSLPIGDITPQQMHGLADLLRANNLNEIHTTQDQNLAIPNVAQKSVAGMRATLSALGLREPCPGDNVVACPGTSTCRLGITSSTSLGPRLSGGVKDLRIRVSGCHNGCAQPETGDIGIYGEGKRLHGKLVPHYQIYLGGNGMGSGALALKGPSVPAARIELAITRLEKAHQDSSVENFFAWTRAQTPDYFKNLLSDIIEVAADDVVKVMRDHGDTQDFSVMNLGGGECAGATQVLIGANFFEAAHERKYRNALLFQHKYDEAAHCNTEILRLLGGGLVQLLGGVRLDELTQLAEQLKKTAPVALTDEFTHLAGLLSNTPEMSSVITSQINSAVDAWTLKTAAFCTAQDEQLDLSEALPLLAINKQN